MSYMLFIILPLSIFFVNMLFIKKRLINNYNGEKHQKFIGKKNIPLTGGLFLSLISIAIFYNDYFLMCIFLLIISLIGFCSDIKFLSSPRLRFLLQTITILIFVYLSELHIKETKIILLDFLLENIFISILFTTFCLTIIINGTNFIDGLNGLTIGYFLAISLMILKLGFIDDLYIEQNKLVFFIYLLICLFILNVYNKLYLGDSGAYGLGFIISFFLITIYQNNQNISAFYIVLLLWYPAFENLFSIIRKFRLKRSPIYPDSKHLHQLLFYFIKKKFKKKETFSNNLSSILILIYNLSIFIIASMTIHKTQHQLILIALNIIIYIFVYIRLFNFSFEIKSKKNKF